MFLIAFHLVLLLFSDVYADGVLYPRASETRELISLDGFWKFALTNDSYAMPKEDLKKWRFDFGQLDTTDLRTMPVPSSYNDIGTDIVLRDHFGIVWYERSFFVPKSWSDQKVWIRFASVSRGADVWINGEWTVNHEVGYLPFQAEISSLLNFGKENTVSVAVNNTLDKTTIPQGTVNELSNGRLKQTFNFDFFNYAGIDRPVVLYTTPQSYIDDITVTTSVDGTTGLVNYSISPVYAQGARVHPQVTLLDKAGTEVASATTLDGVFSVENANLWWPHLMDPNPGYLYTLQVQLLDSNSELVDTYKLSVGIRTITWDNKSVKINDKPIYLRGVGRHEDSDFRGRGLELSVVLRDYNLGKWLGANSLRTSHYPYAEEIMDLADELGIMVIEESPAVITASYNKALRENHKQVLTEMVQRDKNRASVIIWSAANEPRVQNTSQDYYQEVMAHLKSLDATRPIIVVSNVAPDVDNVTQFADIAAPNLFMGWDTDTGDIDVITAQVLDNVRQWNKILDKPVIVAEYGADTMEGLHYLPTYVWSEEFQDAFLAQYFQAFDQLRDEGILIGELIWNFADFKTPQKSTEVGGNKKGIFTRSREPKSGAHLLRKRYWGLAQDLDGADVPDDLDGYVLARKTFKKTEA